MNTFDLRNKVIVITGGTGHLGNAIAKSLSLHNATVYSLGRELRAFEKAFGTDTIVKYLNLDLSSTLSISSAFSEVVRIEGKIDVLINNGFYSRGQSPEEMSDKDFLFGIEGTLSSTFKCIREIIPYFKSQSSGKIINVSSMYGLVAPDFDVYQNSPQYLNPPHYGAAKAGIIQLTKYYASYLGQFGVQVNAVTPGPFPSYKVQKDKEFIKQLSGKTLLGRIGKPEDLVGVFILLASDASNFITGQNIIVDGGWTVR
ncbi:MAG: SDR family oxidoreductase [Chryseotalea sp.]|jgi:gluconate 5-dehydrogenase|nr:SDR family oxidoreductase [Flammeovirgaceae bacterium]